MKYVDSGNASDVQNTIDSLPGDGGTIVISEGNYNFTKLNDDFINVTSGTNLIARDADIAANRIYFGNDTRIISQNSEFECTNSYRCVRENGDASNVVFKGWKFTDTIDGSRNRSYLTVEYGNFSNIKVIDNHFQDIGSTAVIFGHKNGMGSVKNGIIRDNTFEQVYGGIGTEGSEHIRVSSNFLTSHPNSGSSGNEGMDFNSGSDITVKGNHIKGFYEEGIDLNAQKSSVTENRIILGDVGGFVTKGIHLNHPKGSAASNNVITMGSSDSRDKGIGIRNGAGKSVSGNLINGTTGNGIYLYNDGEKASITGNTVKGVDKGVVLDGNKSIASSNVFGDLNKDLEDNGEKNVIIGESLSGIDKISGKNNTKVQLSTGFDVPSGTKTPSIDLGDRAKDFYGYEKANLDLYRSSTSRHASLRLANHEGEAHISGGSGDGVLHTGGQGDNEWVIRDRNSSTAIARFYEGAAEGKPKARIGLGSSEALDTPLDNPNLELHRGSSYKRSALELSDGSGGVHVIGGNAFGRLRTPGNTNGDGYWAVRDAERTQDIIRFNEEGPIEVRNNYNLDMSNNVINNTEMLSLDKTNSLPDCNSDREGGIMYNGTDHLGCDGSNWQSMY